jgi:hypothetical protein
MPQSGNLALRTAAVIWTVACRREVPDVVLADGEAILARKVRPMSAYLSIPYQSSVHPSLVLERTYPFDL